LTISVLNFSSLAATDLLVQEKEAENVDRENDHINIESSIVDVVSNRD
jgi:hypothetical protein